MKNEEYDIPDYLIEFLPNWLLSGISNLSPDEFIKGYINKINIDEAYPKEVIYALSFYETLTPEKRKLIQENINKLDLKMLLEFIGRTNEPLFNKICQMHDDQIPVLSYLDLQLIRIKKLIILFEKKVRGELIDPRTNGTA